MKDIWFKMYFLLLIAFCASGVFSQNIDFPNQMYLNRDKTVNFFWLVENDTITFELQYNVVGETIYWVGFGLSEKGSMPGSDLVIMFWKNGKPQFTDRHLNGDDRCNSAIDETQDYVLLKSQRNATNVIMRMKRKLDTCDDNDYVISNDTSYAMYAIGTYGKGEHEPPITNSSIRHHKRRNSAPVVLLGKPREKIVMTPDVKSWDMLMGNVTIPEKETTYWCKYFKLPEYAEQTKHHYIGYDIVISEGMYDYVHHIVLYQCKGDTADYEAKIKQPGFDCTIRDTFGLATTCQPPLAIWGVGADGQSLPHDVGYVVSEKFGGFSYFIVQMHYNNAQIEKGLVDNSGIKAFFTPKLRPIEGATFQLSSFHSYNLIVPPNQPSFMVTTYCPPECTSVILPPTGIKVFSLWLHEHKIGRKLRIRHFRGGVELPPLIIDDNYFFDLQQFRRLPNEVTLMPGDLIFNECEYDTSEIDVTTLGGVQTSNEMCYALLEYYPRVNFSMCISGAVEADFLHYFGINSIYPNSTIKSPSNLNGTPITKYLEEYKWGNNQTRYEEFQRIQKGPKDGYCSAEKGAKIQSFRVNYPKTPRMNPPKRNCKKN